MGKNYWKQNKYEFCDLSFSHYIDTNNNEIQAYRDWSFETEDSRRNGVNLTDNRIITARTLKTKQETLDNRTEA